jgi:hypothetical protein
MKTYTVILTEHQRSQLIATLRIENERLQEYLTSFDRAGDEAERGRIHADIAENIELINHLKAAANNQG